MNRIFRIFGCIALLGTGVAVAVGQTPQPPELSREAAGRLPDLARQAMRQYLQDRRPAEAIPIPPELAELQVEVNGKVMSFADLEFPVILTLRREGTVVSRSVQGGFGLARNVIRAALQAMRGPALPDRVTREYLDLLTVELEILGPEVPLEPERLESDLRVGLDGLKLSLGISDPQLRDGHFAQVHQEAMVSPTTAYVLGWDASRMRTQGLTDIRWRAENRSLPRRWSRFAVLHYVSYPEGTAGDAPKGTWFLYRGKLLAPPPPAEDASGRLEAAQRVGDFLRRHQTAAGEFQPPGARTSIGEQLHAARALARLGAAVGSGGESYRAAARAALGAVAREYVRLREEGKQASVFTVDPRQETFATAMFVLAAAEISSEAKGRAVANRMLAFLRSAMGKDGRFPDAEGKPLDDVSTAVALLAIQTADPDGGDAAWRDSVEALLYDAGELDADVEAVRPLSDPGEVWLGCALLAGQCGGKGQPYRPIVERFLSRLLKRQSFQEDPADEYGAIRTRTGRAETLPTALALVLLHQARSMGLQASSRQDDRAIPTALEAGWAFCRQMIYQPEEAYFAPNPVAWRGGVRERTDSAKVSLGACAAVIEALLLK